MKTKQALHFICYNYYFEFLLITYPCNSFLFLINKNFEIEFVKKSSNIQVMSASLLVITGLMIFPSIDANQLAFAESDKIPQVKASAELQKNPLAMKIIAEMEAQKLRFKQLSEETTPKSIPTLAQIEIEENRKISEEMLKEDLKSMEKKYIDFTPKNAFAKFVSKLNETYHGIFWDQFDYLNTKVQLAIAAKNVVLENGGSYYEAQREYFKYASMPRLEMISYIQELNVKYGFADKEIQSNFDPYGKLPRFEDDNDAPCYGCKISNDNSGLSNIQNAEVDPKAELKILQEKLTNLQKEFLKETNTFAKKSIMNALNDTVKEIQNLTYDKKVI